MRRATLVLALLLGCSAFVAVHGPSADAAPGSVDRLQALDREILAAINDVRSARGLRRLSLSAGLQEAAVSHSRSMLERGFFAHESADGSPFTARIRRFYPAAGYRSWSAGENLIYATDGLSAPTAIRAWLDSPPHRDNLLNPRWREVGIGSLRAASAGGAFGGEATWVVTLDFGARVAAAKASGTTPGRTRPASLSTPVRRTQPGVKPVRRQIDRVLPGPVADIQAGSPLDPAPPARELPDDDVNVTPAAQSLPT